MTLSRRDWLMGAGALAAGTLVSTPEALRAADVGVTRYHGRLAARERRENQDAFMSGARRVMVATNAFGLGVDKANVEEKLEGVKIDGDKAAGTLVRTVVGKDKKERVKREPVEFVKIDGGWRIIPSMEFDDKEEKKDKD